MVYQMASSGANPRISEVTVLHVTTLATDGFAEPTSGAGLSGVEPTAGRGASRSGSTEAASRRALVLAVGAVTRVGTSSLCSGLALVLGLIERAF